MTQKQFSTMMDHYNNDNDSEILTFAIRLLNFSSFLGVAYLVIYTLT